VNRVVASTIALGILATVGGGAKAEPITLSAADMDQVTAGGKGFHLKVHKNQHQNIKLNVEKTVQSLVLLFGHLADAEAAATATGPNTLAETLTLANVSFAHGKSESFSQSIAAASKSVPLH
jgi:hypothetical protein